MEISRVTKRGGARTKPHSLTPNQRFDRLWSPEPNTGCHVWFGSTDRGGYGKFFSGGRDVRAHRFAFERANGKIPSGGMIDHMCRVRACVNPTHLRVVTNKENTTRNSVGPTAINAAKTHCKRGHEFTPENTRISRRGRACRKCALLYRSTP